MAADIIDTLYEENKKLLAYLREQQEITSISNVDSHFRKVLLLSAASYFESIIKNDIIVFVQNYTKSANLILEFIKNKAVERQYHTYFSWSSGNANSFFGLFGSDFREYMAKEIKASPELKDGIGAFMELGELRNFLVHQNFAIFPLEKTSEEIYQLYVKARLFVKMFPDKLKKFAESETASEETELKSKDDF